MKTTILLLLMCVAAGCATEHVSTGFHATDAEDKILKAAPAGWKVIHPAPQEELFSSEGLTDPRIRRIVLLGPQSNYHDWKDRNGHSQRDYVAKECLVIWLVPADFKPDIRPWAFKAGRRPEKVFTSDDLQVYAYDTHHIVDTERFKQVLKECTEISSGEVKLSWNSWRQDIAARLKGDIKPLTPPASAPPPS